MDDLFSRNLGLSPTALGLLRDLIHERTGLYYDDNKHDVLASRLSRRAIELGFSSFLDYYYLLKYDAAADLEWLQVLDALSVPETYFWREFDAVRVLVDLLVPQWATQFPGAPLRIWSSACASGEEPLTIAIALNEAGWLDRVPIIIEASDGSPAAIATAQRGIYRERSFRALPASLRDRYFKQGPSGWQITSDIHTRISWSIVNLRDKQALGRYATAPVIFCRNVFIYFSRDSIRDTVQQFAHHMPIGGYLFLGIAESLVNITLEFVLQEIGGAFVYVKE